MRINNRFRKFIMPGFVAATMTFLSHGFHPVEHNPVVRPESQNSDENDNPSTADFEFIEALRNRIYCNAELSKCPGMAMAVILNGKVVSLETYGEATPGKAVTENTVFRIASVSKGFAGLLAAKLVDQGIIDLNRPVMDYIPEFKIRLRQGRDSIRVWHLLSHTTGFTSHAYSDLIAQGKDIDRLMTALTKTDVRDFPGKSYAYQNAAFSLIEKVIEKTTGVSYAKMLDSLIFKPLQMQTASTSLESIVSAKHKAQGHKLLSKKGFQPIAWQAQYYNTISAGGVNASLKDMVIWLNAVMGYYPEVLSDNVRELAFTPRANTSGVKKYFNNWENSIASYYGLGWRIVDFPERRIIFHGGNVNGFRTEIAFDPEKQIGVVFLFNSTCSYSNQAVPNFFSFFDDYYSAT